MKRGPTNATIATMMVARRFACPPTKRPHRTKASVAVGDQEVLELPRVVEIDVRLVVAVEVV